MTDVRRRSARRILAACAAALLLASSGVAVAHPDDDDDHDHGPLSHLLDNPARRGLVPPPGFAAHPWAAAPAPAALDWGPDGRLYVLSLTGQVTAFHPVPGDVAGVGVPFHLPRTLMTTNGLAVDPDVPGRVYVSEWYSQDGFTWGRVLAVTDTNGDGRSDTTEVMLDGLPGGQHWVNDLAVHPTDGKLYVTNGNRTDNGIDCSTGGECPDETDEPEYPWRAGAILRVDRDARDLRPTSPGVDVVAHGMRNVYDVAFWPTDPTVAFTATNGPQDPAGDDLLYRTSVDGAVDDMGFPSCLVGAHERGTLVEDLLHELGGDGGHHHHGHSLEPESTPDTAVTDRFGACDPATVAWPIATFGGHGSANGLAFAHGSAFPGTYGNDVFVALWGSLEASHPAAGHKVARVNLRDDGSVVVDESGMPWVQQFATGGAPLDLTFGPDGAMYVADNAGVITRIAWVGGVVPPNDEHDGHGHHDHGGDHHHGGDHGGSPPDECATDTDPEVGEGNGKGKGKGNGKEGKPAKGAKSSTSTSPSSLEGCEDGSGGHDHDVDYRGIDPDSYATPDHPSYDYATDDDRHHDVMFRRLWGCDVEHPYFRWLVDEVKHHITTKTPDLRAALLSGYTPMSPIPNDFGYPETYWHWWHLAYGPQTHPEHRDPTSMGYRDAIVQPQNWIEYLLMVPEHVTHPHRENVNWTVEGVMFAIPHDGPGPNLYGPIEGVQQHPCNPFHDHGDGIDNPHFHIWPWHHVHPLAMNPPHLCDGQAEMKDTYWPLRDTWHCVYDGDRNDPDVGAHDPDNPWRDGGGHEHGGHHHP